MNYQQTQREHAPITFDPADFAGMCRIMDTHGDSTVPFFGRNENGEDTCLSVFYDKITVRTHQRNGSTARIRSRGFYWAMNATGGCASKREQERTG